MIHVGQVRASGQAVGGFTLLELVVAMGLLSGFLIMLVNLLTAGASMFDQGERGQEMLDRANAAARATRSVLEDGAGPRWIDSPDSGTDARLVVHFAPLGLGLLKDAPRMQVYRSTSRLSAVREDAMLLAAFTQIARDDGADAEEAEEIAREQAGVWTRGGRGEVLLLPWPADETGVYLELRRMERPLDPLLLPPDELGLIELAASTELELVPERIRDATRTIATGLLHFELQLWSQRTERWTDLGARGPETTWDSARAGLLIDDEGGPEDFRLDVGASSLSDPRDDVWPRWVRVTLVVGGPPTAPPPATLSRAASASDSTIVVTRPEQLPDPADNPWVKVGAEWVRFEGVSGRSLTGVRRGQRGTRALDHTAGTPVRDGRMVVFDVPIAHGRDADV